MNAELKKLAVLTVATLLLCLSFPNMKIAFSGDTYTIDLFTQKEPYSGKGPNMPSDAFGPQEHVILYALVTCNEAPMQNILVAFYIRAPTGFSFSFSEKTNASGIATINFTIPHPCDNETEFFGEWYTLANAYVGDTLVQDSLTFRVDWIVKLISVRTINENLSHRIDFGIGGDVGLEITLRSIAKTVKNATISITLQDELCTPVSFYEICDFKVQPNEKPVFLYCKLHIPKWAVIGEATVSVSALKAPTNASEVPYCPTISTMFYILPYAPLTITFHDVAVVDAVPSARSVEAGEIVNISAIIQNEGTENESFNVSAYYDNYLIETLSVTLASHSWTTLNFTFNTTTVAPANYTIKVSIPPLINEADLTDNTLIDGMVEVKPKLPIVVHNIGVLEVKTSADTIHIGDLLQINVSVINNGTETETFNVKVYYDNSLIETKVVNALLPTAQQTLTFTWNTSSVSEGFYQISAFAPLDGDVDPSDNTFVNGVIHIVKPPKPLYFLTVKTEPPNVAAIPGEGWYEENTNASLTAPFTVSLSDFVRYKLSHWDVDGIPQNIGANSISVLMDANHTATAHYILQYYLAVRTDPPGIVTIYGEAWHDNSTNVTLNAPAVYGYTFKYWDIDGVLQGENVNPITVHMNAPHNATAHYVRITYTLAILATEGGTTDPAPGNYTYPVNTTVQVKAIPNANYVFDHWELDNVNVGSANPYQVIIDKNHVLKAVFSPVAAGWFVPEWFYWLLFLILVLIVFLLVLLLYSRKKRRETEVAFRSGWTAWYYCRSLRCKFAKIKEACCRGSLLLSLCLAKMYKRSFL
ncbi:MAG: CARDB domain-containing protein [Candidatus Bathyarchaeia archaeon]